MPYAIEHNHGTKTYQVVNLKTGQVHAHNATLPHAEAQVRLLHHIEDQKYRDMEKYNRGRLPSLRGQEKREKKLNKMDPEERQEEVERLFKIHHG
jgi:hypothetical protein